MKTSQRKRGTVKKLLGMGAAGGLLATQWHKPVVNAVLLPAHAQTSNRAPVGQNLDAPAFENVLATIDLEPNISDPDGDMLSISVVDTGFFDGNPLALAFSVSIVGLTFQVESQAGIADAVRDVFIDYTVSDGELSSPTYRITLRDLGFDT